MERYIRSLGRSLIDIAVFLSNFTVFSNNVIKTFIKLKLFNPAVYIVFMRQIYFTGVQILPVYIVISLIMGVALVGSLSSATNLLGSGDQVGRIFVVITFQQLAPLLTAILLALRSATAVTAEISLMKINREIDTLRSMSIDPYEYLYLPRITAGIICMVALSTIFVCVATIGGYLILSLIQDISLDYMLTTVMDNLEMMDILSFLIKIFFLGFALMSIPIYTALEAKNAVTEIPIALLRGMMRLFYAFIFIELVTVAMGIYI